ncbi:Ppx/GppA family phosphatase [Thiotrichales bacterium 19S9-12]|nr:Ppx/GppA family phosphatase [Thiotrichales bacterium 19S9-11]MCF6812069.1 Ppx/GppA family phosphatase [Thiotrichales bacterium 19S9-12]
MRQKILATIDLGSNSFHILISSVIKQKEKFEIKTLYRNKSKVQLRSGLDEQGYLSEKTQKKALKCLASFSDAMKKHKVTDIKILGTYTLRKAQINNQAFLDEAALVVGAPIEVISGEEEARIIYVGASNMAKLNHMQTLIVDIGGGSTELVIGKGSHILELKSIDMGCVSMQDAFFSDNKLTLSNFVCAISYAKSMLKPLVKKYHNIGWDVALGASGTIRSVASIMKELKWSNGDISQEGLDGICAKLIKLKLVNEISLPGLRVDRENILPGGFCILYAIFDMFNLKAMQQSKGALREGMLYEMLEQP